MLKVAVILPVYNEAKCIARTWDAVLEFSNTRPYYHFTFVNDGSTDQTKQILSTKLATTSNSKIRVIEYENNKGKGYAIKTAVECAYEDFICFIDSDLAYSLEHLELVVEKLDEFDVVIGCRNLILKNIKQVNLNRKLAGKIFNAISRKLLHLPFYDMQAGIKGFKKDVVKEVFQKQRMTGFSFDVELIFLAQKKGYKIGQIPAIVSKEHLNKASKVNLLIDSIRMLLDLLKIKYNDIMGEYE
ncbi:MAG: glycosyltransferase [Chroococcidiopsidaceae cyanobacterium CP_BM_ER_R8_30]|nr:glycosyltransferase [Chroococcidiopsidaceae cyanobacterium CP_BM_ER_R8_30]